MHNRHHDEPEELARTVAIPCNSPKNPSWIFLGRMLGRAVTPAPDSDHQEAAAQLKRLLIETVRTKPDALIAATASVLAEQSDTQPPLTTRHRQAFLGPLVTSGKNAIGQHEDRTPWNPRTAYASDFLAGHMEWTNRLAEQQILAERGEARVLTDKDPIPFGPFAGTPLGQVRSGYLERIAGAPWLAKYPGVSEYIERHRKAIEKDLPEVDELAPLTGEGSRSRAAEAVREPEIELGR